MITLYGVTEDGTTVPVQVTDDGKLVVHQDGSFEPGDDIEAGDITCGDITASGDITAAGTATFANGDISIGRYELGAIQAKTSGIGGASGYQTWCDETGVYGKNQGSTGAALFPQGINSADVVQTTAQLVVGVNNTNGFRLTGGGGFTQIAPSVTGNSGLIKCTSGDAPDVFRVNGNGSVIAAGNKCGFTPDGDVYFTSRGDRYKIIVQQGICYADPYPLSAKEKLADKLSKPDTTDIVLPD